MGQQSINPFVQKIKTYNKSLQSQERPKGKQVHFFDYTTEFEYWDKEMAPQKVRTKMFVGEKHLHYFSNVMDVFMDESYVATVMKSQNKIVITKILKDFDPYMTMAKTAKLQNMVLDSAIVISSKETDSGLREIKLNTEDIDIASLKINELTYIINSENGAIQQTITKYSEDYSLKRMSYIQHSIDYKSTYKKFKSVKKMLFNADGKLIDKYKNYEIVVD